MKKELFLKNSAKTFIFTLADFGLILFFHISRQGIIFNVTKSKRSESFDIWKQLRHLIEFIPHRVCNFLCYH